MIDTVSGPAAPGLRTEGRCTCGGLLFRGGYAMLTEPDAIRWHPYVVCSGCGRVIHDDDD